MKFRTMNSIYTIDKEAMTWSREVFNPESNLLLADEGPLIQLPEVVVGQRCILTEGRGGLHIIVYTSTVTEIIE